MADASLTTENDFRKFRVSCGIDDPAKHYLQYEFEELLTRPETMRFLDNAGFSGFWLRDLGTHEDEWLSPGFWRALGYDPATRPHTTRAWQAIAFREDREQAQRDLIRHCNDPAHPYDQFIRFRTASGDTLTMRSRGVAIRENGLPTRMLGVNMVIGESDAVGISPLANEVFESLDDAVILWSDRRGIQRWNGGARALYGYGEDEVLGRDPCTVLAHTLTSDWDDILKTIYAGQTWRGELSLRAKAGEMVPAVTTFRRAAQIGDETLFVQIGRDEREVLAERSRHALVLRELNHRVKNLFSVVVSIILMSGRMEGNRPDFVDILRRRIFALSQAHASSLSANAATRAGADQVLLVILMPYAVQQNRLAIEGGNAPLAIAQLTPFGLIVNEFGARAARQGAWSDAEGMVSIEVRRDREKWTMIWRERGAVEPASDEVEEGFGTKLIAISAQQLGGTVTHDWQADGLVATLSFPVVDQHGEQTALEAAA